MSPSSGGWGRVDLFSWARQKELVSITGPVDEPTHYFRTPEPKQSRICKLNIT
jgi:hypothetical protein